MFKNIILSLLIISFNTLAGDKMDSARYSAYFKVQGSICILSVNGLDYLSTLDGSRTISTGSDISDSLENDKENNIGIIFYPSRSKKERKDYSCEIKVVKSTLNKPDELITNFKVTFDSTKNRSFDDPEGYSILDINDMTKNPIIRGISNRIKFKGDDKPKDWLTAHRSFSVSGIPVWQWTKATPQVNNQDLRNQLIYAYKDLINDLKNNDLDGVRGKYSIALNEYAITDLTDDTELFFNSIGIEDALKKGKINLNQNWDRFKILTYQNNRIFCLAIGGSSRKSPIQFIDENGKHILSWNPFFAVIDNKMVLVR